MSPLWLVTFVTAVSSGVLSSPQSNYADQANNVEYVGGLPEQATLDGKVTKLDDLSPVIFLNRTKAALNCAAGSMQVDLKFNEPFYGVAYADFDRHSSCRTHGKPGGLSYRIEIPLKGCGTKQGPRRVFTNNINVRFHHSLEIDGDEIITIVCRYPGPVAPLAPVMPEPVKIDHNPQAVAAPALTSFQIMLIICGILFLSLLLLGLGCTNYCLRRRHIPLARPFSSIGTNSEITKLSSSSLGNLSIFDPVKIPRAHAPVQATASSSGSDGPLISDTLPSDYPSESHSEIEELDTRSLPVSSAGSFENKAYVHDNSSVYSDGGAQTTVAAATRVPAAIREQPKFDVQMRVNRAPPSPASLAISDTDSSISRTERNLSTILEREETSRPDATQFTYIPELHPPPRHVQPAPTYNKILKRQQELQELASLNSEMTDTHSITEMVDTTHRIKGPAPPPPHIMPKQQHMVSMDRSVVFEPPPQRKPEITSHMVDDVFLRTITEKKTIEDIERHKRLVTEYHTRPMEQQKWDVTIRNYPLEMPEPPEWENFSDISSASGLTLTNLPERYVDIPPPNVIHDNKLPLNSPELVGSLRQPYRPQNYLSTFNLPVENPEVPNWNVLLRVLQPQEQEIPTESHETFSTQLSMSDKMKWRQIITTESTLRTLLTEAVVREDYERIRRDARYETLFEPIKWDVIIRILAPNDKQKSRFKKKGEWDNRSRRSSLPTLYEYDSDGESSVRTLTREPMEYPLPRSRRTSRSSFKSEADLRSMSEMTVDFGRPDMADSQSESSHYFALHRYDDDETDSYYRSGAGHPSLARSLSQPSLARSASEFTEHWGAPSRYDTASEYTSPEATPKAVRSTKMMQMQSMQGPSGAEQSSMWQARSSSQMRSMPGGGTAQVMSSEMSSQSTSRMMSRQRQNWFDEHH